MSLAKKLKSKGIKKLPQRKPNPLKLRPNETVCKGCGKTFTGEERLIKSGRKQYCSRSCRSRTVALLMHKERKSRIEELDEKRFWKKVVKSSGCWIWTGGLFTNGYGQFWRTSGSMPAHRYSYYLHFEDLEADSQICHRCDNPLCVNPAHLFQGNALINKHDSMNKDRHSRGERVNTAKITKVQVRQIRAAAQTLSYSGKKKRMRELFIKFPEISDRIIKAVVYGHTWRHVK